MTEETTDQVDWFQRTATAWMELEDVWIYRLTLNLLGYATIVVPGYLFIRWIRKSHWLDTAAPSCHSRLIRLCVFGNDAPKSTPAQMEEGLDLPPKEVLPPEDPGFFWKFLKITWCVTGLLVFYLTWGLIQERIMAFKYGADPNVPDSGENFKNSQFLVFVNRILAFVVAGSYILATRQPRHMAPLYKYSYSSFSNIMSSWCQYEALKFVSFPTQVLAKSCKVIAVMLMGKVVSNRTYQLYEYASAGLISLGVCIFMLSSGDAVKDHTASTTLSGIIILLGYLAFDSFTSNWQGELFRAHKMTSIQMMCGVNLFSVVFTCVSLLEQGGFFESATFIFKYPEFVMHCVVLSICSALGQLFIFYTISEFGAVVFTIIMTVRQGLAILLSCLIYSHPVGLTGILGVLLVFLAISIRIYMGQMKKKPSIKPSG